VEVDSSEETGNNTKARIVAVTAQSSLVQASAPRTVRVLPASATLGKPLSREFLLTHAASLDAGGQWPVCTREPRLPRIRPDECVDGIALAIREGPISATLTT
jgi:hypothetical protein